MANPVVDFLRKTISLDTPEMSTGETVADIAAGFVPGVGTALSARDFERSRREGSLLGMGLSGLGMIPIVGGVTRGVSKAVKAGAKAEKAAAPASAAFKATTPEHVAMLRGGAEEATAKAERKAAKAAATAEKKAAKESEVTAAKEAALVTSRAKAEKLPVGSPERAAAERGAPFPRIYTRPDELVRNVKVAPEDSAMKRLFGVDREDLYQISQQGTRSGNIAERPFVAAPGAKGAKHAGEVMTPENEQRLIDTIAEARKRPDVFKGMASWYTMDPLYWEFVRLHGKQNAPAAYR